MSATCVAVACDGAELAAGDPDGEIGDLLEAIETEPRGFVDDDLCEQVFTFDRDVELQDGTVLHVREAFTPRSVLRFPRRGLLMLPGTLVTNELYDAQVPGAEDASALARAAQQGYFAFAVTYEGYPGSSLPADGASVDADRLLDTTGELLERLRWERGIPRMDILGTSIGSSLAIALGGQDSPISRHHVGRIVLTALVYQEVTPLFEQVFFSPEVQALLESAPDGYVQTVADFYGLILLAADPSLAAWGFESFPDVYATGPTLEGFELPVFAAERGRAPALQWWGSADPITPFADVEAFQGTYGGPVGVSTLDGAGHAPFLAGPEQRDDFWEGSFAFLDDGRWGFFLACEPDEEVP